MWGTRKQREAHRKRGKRGQCGATKRDREREKYQNKVDEAKRALKTRSHVVDLRVILLPFLFFVFISAMWVLTALREWISCSSASMRSLGASSPSCI